MKLLFTSALKDIKRPATKGTKPLVLIVEDNSDVRTQLHRKLKALTDKSPNEIIRQMRLQRARKLLEKRAGNASEVAFMVGFNSLAYFSKCFKDQFGIPPSAI